MNLQQSVNPQQSVEEVIRHRLSQAIGGWRGSLEAALPTIAFVIVWTAKHNLSAALIAAAVVLCAALVLRLVQKSTPRYVLMAFGALAIAAIFAKMSGKASAAFLPGILQSAFMFVVSMVSIFAKWPLAGFIASAGDPKLAEDPLAWRRSPGMVAVCTRLTWVFAGMYAIRVAIMFPLYLANQVTALGVCKIVLGWPLYLVALAGMAGLLLRGHTPLEVHDAMLHEDAAAPESVR